MLSMMNVAGAAAQEQAAQQLVEQATQTVVEQAAQTIAAPALEAGTQTVVAAVTSDNAAGMLSSLLNSVSHCPSFVTDALDATVGENPYVRAGATLLTAAALAVGTYATFKATCGKKKPAAKPGKTEPEVTVTPPGGEGSAPSSGDEYADAAGDEALGAEGELGEEPTPVSGARRRRNAKQ